MLYRIFIPALQPDGVSMTLDVEAENWMLALRYGLDEIGADRDLVKRAVCDIKGDNTIHVMEPAQGRVFVLREVPASDRVTTPPDRPENVGEPTPQIQLPAVPEVSVQRIPTEPELPMAIPVQIPEVTDEIPVWAEDVPGTPTPFALPPEPVRAGRGKSEGPTQHELPPLPRMNERTTEPVLPAVRSEKETVLEMPAVDPSLARSVSTSAPPLGSIDYPLNEADLEKYFEKPPERARRSISHLNLQAVMMDSPRLVSREPSEEIASQILEELRTPDASDDDLMAVVYEEMQEIDFAGSTIDEGLEFALELAVKRLPSEAGWMMLVDLNERDLYFAAATGPKAEEVMSYRLPFGKGIAGFCTVNGVSLALADVERDPRFQSEISRSVGYKLDSVACAPIQLEGRVFGAIQLMNRRNASEYRPSELEVLNYVAKRTAEYLSQNMKVL